MEERNGEKSLKRNKFKFLEDQPKSFRDRINYTR